MRVEQGMRGLVQGEQEGGGVMKMFIAGDDVSDLFPPGSYVDPMQDVQMAVRGMELDENITAPSLYTDAPPMTVEEAHRSAIDGMRYLMDNWPVKATTNRPMPPPLVSDTPKTPPPPPPPRKR